MLAFGTSARADPAPKVAPTQSAREPTPVAPAKDVVKLKNGGLLRGSIAELVPGEFVVIVLITGETRRVPAAEFDYAGPDQQSSEGAESDEEQAEEGDEEEEAEEEEEETPARRRRARKGGPSMDQGSGEELVSVNSTSAPLKVYVRAPSEGDGSGKTYSELCKTPCDVYMKSGEYEMALSALDSDEPVAARERVSIDGTANLEATYQSRSGLRGGGVVIMLIGAVAGIAIIADAAGSQGKEDTAQVTLGGLVLGGGIAAGIVMMTRADIVEIDVVPSASSLLPPRGALAGLRDSSTGHSMVHGLGIAARF